MCTHLGQYSPAVLCHELNSVQNEVDRFVVLKIRQIESRKSRSENNNGTSFTSLSKAKRLTVIRNWGVTVTATCSRNIQRAPQYLVIGVFVLSTQVHAVETRILGQHVLYLQRERLVNTEQILQYSSEHISRHHC